MTTDSHLDLILAHCRKCLAIAEKRTQGKLKVVTFNSPIGDTGDYEGVIQLEAIEYRESDPVLLECWNPEDEDEGNFDFIAACAGSAEAGWTATIAAIRSFRSIRANIRSSVTAISEATDAIQSILAAYPLDLIK